MTTPIAQGPVDVNVRGELCDTCGRPIHPCDDPECMPWNKPLAERLQWALEENSRLRRCMLTAYDSWAEILDSACETMEMAAMHDESSYKELKRLHAEMRGLMTPNEGRAKENLPPIEGGDQALVQRQMTPLTLVQDLAVAELAAKSAPPSASPSASQAPPPEENDVEDEDEALTALLLA